MNRLLWMNRWHLSVHKNNVLRNPSILLNPQKSFPNTGSRSLHDQKKNVRSTLNYMVALGVMTVGLSYAAVPLYRIFCQVSKKKSFLELSVITLFIIGKCFCNKSNNGDKAKRFK